MRNSFKGKVTDVTDQGFYYEVSITVEAVTFKSLITKNALFDLEKNLGTLPVLISFRRFAHSFFSIINKSPISCFEKQGFDDRTIIPPLIQPFISEKKYQDQKLLTD